MKTGKLIIYVLGIIFVITIILLKKQYNNKKDLSVNESAAIKPVSPSFKYIELKIELLSPEYLTEIATKTTKLFRTIFEYKTDYGLESIVIFNDSSAAIFSMVDPTISRKSNEITHRLSRNITNTIQVNKELYLVTPEKLLTPKNKRIINNEVRLYNLTENGETFKYTIRKTDLDDKQNKEIVNNFIDLCSELKGEPLHLSYFFNE